MTDAPDKTAPTMTADEALRHFGRLALLSHLAVDIPHAQNKGKRLVGWIVEPDEHYQRGDGLKMLQALQVLADMDVRAMREQLADCATAPWEFPGRPTAPD